MTVTIELSPEIEASLVAQAQAEGLAVSEYVQNLVRERIKTRSANGGMVAPYPALNLPPEQWIQEFRAWSQSPVHAHLPVLTDEAMSRESIYEGRGL